jgi:hypothetical protein
MDSETILCRLVNDDLGNIDGLKRRLSLPVLDRPLVFISEASGDSSEMERAHDLQDVCSDVEVVDCCGLELKFSTVDLVCMQASGLWSMSSISWSFGWALRVFN